MNDLYEPNASPAGPAGMAPYAPPLPGAGAGYESLFQILWRGRWLILLCVLLAGAGAYAYLRFATPMYDSTARLLVEKPSTQTRSDVPQPVGSTMTNYLATQASMITSPEILGAALRDPNVLTLPVFSDPSYLRAVVGTLTAEVAKKADIIQITASAPHPEGAARLVNAVVRAYIRWHEANRQLTTADLLKDLNSQLDNRYRELQLKRREQMLFEQRNPQVLESTPGGMIPKSLEMLRDELAAARLSTVQRESYYQGLGRLEKEPDAFREYVYSHQPSLTTVVTATVAAGEHSERFRLELELERTTQQLEEIPAVGAVQHTRIAMLQKRQADLEKKIADFEVEFVRQQVLLAKTLLEDARTQEQKLTEMYAQEFAKAQNLSEQDSQYASLKSECELMEAMCNSLLGQISQLDLGARLESLKIYRLERAQPAQKASSPQPVRVVGIALVLGLMAGAGLSLLRDWRDQRVRSPDEITALVGAPILGAIPSISRRALRRGQKLRFATNSRESEACRAIRTALLCGRPREQARTILVTSPGPQEGKTLLVSNLGMVLAQAGQRTLIVDADLRKPVKRRVFVMNGHSRGLVDVLLGSVGLDEAIRPTEIERLEVLESGQSTANPSELLNGPAFAALLEQLKGRYDRILIDSPPVGLVTDAQILATLCDATLLVLRAEESSRILTQRAREALYAVGAQVTGTVVNDVSRKNGRYGVYSGYGNYYAHPAPNGRRGPQERPPTEAGPRPRGAAPLAEQDEGVEPSDGPTLGPSDSPRVPIREYDGRTPAKESEAQAGPTPGTPISRSADCANQEMGIPSGNLARESGAGKTAAPTRRGNDETPPVNEASVATNEKTDGPTAGQEPRVQAGPQPGQGADVPERKRTGRATIRRGDPVDTGTAPQGGGRTSPPGKGRGEAAGRDRTTEAGPNLQEGDPAAEKWHKWLQGEV